MTIEQSGIVQTKHGDLPQLCKGLPKGNLFVFYSYEHFASRVPWLSNLLNHVESSWTFVQQGGAPWTFRMRYVVGTLEIALSLTGLGVVDYWYINVSKKRCKLISFVHGKTQTKLTGPFSIANCKKLPKGVVDYRRKFRN